MTQTESTTAQSLLLDETYYYKTLAANKKRPLYLHDWLLKVDANVAKVAKPELKKIQDKLLKQLLELFNAYPGAPLRNLIARNISSLYTHGDILSLHETIEKCNELIRSKEQETQMNKIAKLCALNVIGEIYEKLGRMVGKSYEVTMSILIKYMKSADVQFKIEIIQTVEKILYGLGTAGQSIHKDVYKQLSPLVQHKSMAVRHAAVKCLCEMVKHSSFLYVSSSGSGVGGSGSGGSASGASAGGGAGGSGSPAVQANSPIVTMASSSPAAELESNVQLAFKALDNSSYELRVTVSIYLAQLIYYSLVQLEQQQSILQHQQQLANAIVANPSTPDGSANASKENQQKRQQVLRQQQNLATQALMNEKIKNTLGLLSKGFNKQTGSSMPSFKLGRTNTGANSNQTGVVNHHSDSSSVDLKPAGSSSSSTSTSASSGSQATQSPVSSTNSQSSSSSSSASSNGQINREVRIGVTYAYVELANLLGSKWLERNLKLYLTSVLNLVNGTKSVANHLDAVYSRKCVQFILRSIIGGMLNEKMQLEAARLLLNIIDKCVKGQDALDDKKPSTGQQHHVLICSLYELSCILKTLNTSASILVSDDASLKQIILSALVYPNEAVKCVSAWCLRALTCSLPALMTPLLDHCMDKLSLIRNPSDALLGYGYACAALLGAVRDCPLGIPSLKPKLAFNIAEELLRTASQSNNLSLALHKTSIGWLLLGAFMTMGATVVRKHLPRIKKLWNLTMPSSQEQIELEKKRGDATTWQLSLESRSGCVSSMHSFLVNCSDLLSQESSEHDSSSSVLPIESAIMLLTHLPNIVRLNANTTGLKAKAAMYRLRLYQCLIALPSPTMYEANFGAILSELVAEFTLADQQLSTLVTSTLRSVCHSNESTRLGNSSLESILFTDCWQQDIDYRTIEDQLQQYSAGGCEALEHDLTYLYQKSYTSSIGSNQSAAAILNATTIKSLSSTSFYASLSSLYGLNSNLTHCQAALPLGVAVIDASIQLYGIMYPKVPNKHRLQMLLHFIECIQKQPPAKTNGRQALQINIFTAVLGSLKSLAENKCDIGDEPVRKTTLRLVMDTLTHSNQLLRCAAGEALGRMAQVIAESHFVVDVAQYCFEKLKNSQDSTESRTGYALGLGCLHRYVGSMGAGQHITSSVSILFGMAQSSSGSAEQLSPQVWAIHALYLIIDSGGSMFRNYIEPCVEFIVQSVLNSPFLQRDVLLALGKLLSSIITFMGPELQMNTPGADDIRRACLTTCQVMQKHTDSMIRAQSIECLQELHLFASSYVDLNSLVPYLTDTLVCKEYLPRKVAVSCLRQLCQKNALEVCRIARDYVKQTQPIGLICLINERGLQYLLFKMLDIETNPFLIRDLHDILYSLLCTSLNECTIKDWLFLCKDIAISTEDSLGNSNQISKTNESRQKTSVNKKRHGGDATSADLAEDNDEDEEENDDARSFHVPAAKSNEDYIMRTTSAVSRLNTDQLNSRLKLKQITKMISPKWPNRVFAFELIRRIIALCQTTTNDESDVKKRAHFDLQLARRLKSQQADENYLIIFLQDLMRIACIGATSDCDPLKLVGLDLLHDLILYFANVEEPNVEFKGHLILEQYQAQVSAALRPQFSMETSAHVTAKACQVCSLWISSGVARDLNDLRRVHQLLVSSLQKLTACPNGTSTSSAAGPTNLFSMVNSDQLIYSELSLTLEKLAVLRAWADVYIVAQKNSASMPSNNNKKASFSSESSLLSLVYPELSILSHHWSVALKDYAFLCLPNEYASQLPIEGGAFYHADLVESSKPIYKEHFTKILLAYTIWLNEIKFEIKPLPANQWSKVVSSSSAASITGQEEDTTTIASENGDGNDDDESRLNEQKEKLFFMLLGLSLETLSNTTGLAQLSNETIENILESIDNLLRTSFARKLLLGKTIYLCVEILSILYKVKLTCDLMSINRLVINIIKQINEIRNVDVSDQSDDEKTRDKREKNACALIFVILEICIKDLIKYLPNLLQSSSKNSCELADAQHPQQHPPDVVANTSVSSPSGPANLNKSSFLYIHVTKCKQLNAGDVELLRKLLLVLDELPFHANIALDKRLSLISIVYHILFSLLQSMESLLGKDHQDAEYKQHEMSLLEAIYDSFRVLCSTSNETSCHYKHFEHSLASLVQNQQSALMSLLSLKNVNPCTIMKLLAIFFQQCSLKVFEPLNVYEKCKVFMCSMRCSDNRAELLCMIKSLNEIIINKEANKEIRIILLKEHITYLLKLTSATQQASSTADEPNIPPNNFLSVNTDDGIQLISSLLDLLESMVFLMNDQEEPINDTPNLETLTVYVHILAQYLNENAADQSRKQLNDLVVQKVLNLGKNYKLQLKSVLDKWPNLKVKFGNALKATPALNATPNTSQNRQASKTPKIQLNFNFNKPN